MLKYLLILPLGYLLIKRLTKKYYESDSVYQPSNKFFIQDTISILSSPRRFFTQSIDKPFLEANIFGQTVLYLTGKDNLTEMFKLDGKQLKNSLFPGWKRLMGDVILFESDKTHSKLRELFSRALNKEALKQYEDFINSSVVTFLNENSNIGKVDFYDKFRKFNLELIMSLMFGKQYITEDDIDDVQNYLRGYRTIFQYNLPFTTYRKALLSKEKLLDKVRNIFNKKLLEPMSENPMFIDFVVEGYDKYDLEVDKIVENILFFIFASIDTTTASVCTSLANLSYFDTNELNDFNIECYIRETLRLYPPFNGALKKAEDEVEISGLKIRKGDYVAYCCNRSHFLPDFGDDVLEFNPDRFKSEDSETVKDFKYVFIPFGGGKHMCPGANFAKLVIKTVITNLLKNYHLTIHDKRHNEAGTQRVEPVIELVNK